MQPVRDHILLSVSPHPQLTGPTFALTWS